MTYRLIIISIIALLLSACGKTTPNPADVIANATDAIDNSDWATAQRILDDATADPSAMSVGDLGQISILYMRVADNYNESDNTASATTCYLRAFATQPDSAMCFYESLPIEYIPYVDLLARLSRAITTPSRLADDSVYAEPDSLVDISCNHD